MAKRRYIIAAALLSQTCLVPAGYALDGGTLPHGGTVMGGDAGISQSGTHLHVQQHSDKAVIHWQGFDIGKNASVHFQQNTKNSVALNRVIAGDASRIHGKLTSTGQVYLINPSGVLFADTAQVHVGGLVASTHDISDEDFHAGRRVFTRAGAVGRVENRGRITVSGGGEAVLIGAEVANHGDITAPGGGIGLAAGERVTIEAGAGGRLRLEVDGAALDTAVGNSGVLQADGGTVVLNAQAAGMLHSSVVSNSGTVQARTLANKDGRILLLAGMETGEVQVGGLLDASAPDAGDGGFIETSAAKVRLKEGRKVTTKAAAGKTGEWLIDPTDYTIAATGGDMTGGDLSADLGSTSVTIATVGAGGGNGDIFVRDDVSWNADTTLTLNAHRDIVIEKDITATGANAGLAMTTGAGRDYHIEGGKVTLSGANATFSLNGQGYDVIHNVSQLQMMNMNGFYVLGNAIDATGTTGWNLGNGFLPVALADGQFHGLGHDVTGLYISDTAANDVGLFSQLGANGILRDFSLLNADITGNHRVGGVVGVNHGLISHVHVSGTLMGNQEVGGIAGRNLGAMNDSSAAMVVVGGQMVGGLAGLNEGQVAYSHATGDVTGSANRVGGLLGENTGFVSHSHATGKVEGYSYIGGLIGMNEGDVEYSHAEGEVMGHRWIGGFTGHHGVGTISDSYATGDVTGTLTQVAGFAGWNYAVIRNSYAEGTVKGVEDVGGLVGQNRGTIELSYATGRVEGLDWVGGLIGYNTEDGSIADSYATGDVSGDTRIGGLIGGNSNTAGVVEWSYAEGAVSGSDYIGGLIGENESEINDSDASGAVTASGEFIGGLIGSNRGNLSNVQASGVVSGYELVGGLVGYNNADITYASALGDVTALGDFAGGLIGSNEGDIMYAVASGDVMAGGDFAGGLTGANAGRLETAGASGTVTGAALVGGLVGNNADGIIRDSYAEGAVTASATFAGGLVGQSNGEIHDSYATGAVNAASIAGGLVGQNSKTITGSHASGAVATTGDEAGGLVGRNNISTTITNSHASGDISGANRVGGLVGQNSGLLSQVYATGDVTATGERAGGVVGNNNGTLLNAYATGDIIAATHAGGLAGVSYGLIKDSHALGDVVSLGSYAGGLVGYNSGYSAVEDSYASGEVTGGGSSTGGLVGYNDAPSSIRHSHATGKVNGGSTNTGGVTGINYGTLTDSYATGEVNGGSQTGGLAGYNSGLISVSHATGKVVGGNQNIGGLVGRNTATGIIMDSYATGDTSGTSYIGGLAGRNDSGATIQDSYATGNVSGTSYVGGLVGYQLDSTSRILRSYATGIVNGSLNIGGLAGNNNGIIRNAYARGNVNATGDYAGGLLGINSGVAENVHATGEVAGTDSNFIGGLAGRNTGTIERGYATGRVTGARVSGAGLVGNNAGTIRDSYATGDVVGSTGSLGGLAGNNSGTISRSYATGNVQSPTGYYIGGLVGHNMGLIEESFSTGSANGNNFVGGLVGFNDAATIRNAYATGATKGNTSITGGLVGSNSGQVIHSYSSGKVTGGANSGGLIGELQAGGSVTGSFWDKTASGLTISAGGTGLSTSAMRIKDSFLGWDISAQGGQGTLWRIYEGGTAPLLRGFFSDTVTVTANDAYAIAGRPYSGGNGVRYSSALAYPVFGSVSYGGDSQGAINAGTYTITPQGLYSGQFGYDIIFTDGTLTMITDKLLRPESSYLQLSVRTTGSSQGNEGAQNKEKEGEGLVFTSHESAGRDNGGSLNFEENFIPLNVPNPAN